MAKFRYTAKRMDGKTVRETAEFPSENALREYLEEKELFLIEVKNLTEKKGYKKLKNVQLASFCRELSTLLTAGISLVRALDIICGQEGITREEKEIYQAVLQDVRRGVSLSEAMETKRCFPDLMIGMIRSGEGSGNIDQVTQRLTVQFEKEHRLSQQVRQALTYPMILLVLCVAVVILIVTYILPQFETLFSEMGELPLVTEILVHISDFLTQKWYFALTGICLFVIAIRFLVGLAPVRRCIDYWKVHIKGVGPLCKTIYTARFARTLSSLYSSGMPIVQAIKIAGGTIGNVYVEEQFERVTVQVRSGVSLSSALSEVDGLTKKLSSTIRVGEESGQLDSMLDSIAQMLEEESEMATKRLVTILEPVLICFMALIVAFIMVAVLLPIYQSYDSLE